MSQQAIRNILDLAKGDDGEIGGRKVCHDSGEIASLRAA
jgi:hypothetical protein